MRILNVLYVLYVWCIVVYT